MTRCWLRIWRMFRSKALEILKTTTSIDIGENAVITLPKVYPYAVEAIDVFRKVEEFSKDARKRERKKYIKALQKELKNKYEDPLRNLTKTQGKILTEMIERELDISTYQLIRELKGGVKASFWSSVGRFWGYRL